MNLRETHDVQYLQSVDKMFRNPLSDTEDTGHRRNTAILRQQIANRKLDCESTYMKLYGIVISRP
jgi:hypothetical protein